VLIHFCSASGVDCAAQRPNQRKNENLLNNIMQMVDILRFNLFGFARNVIKEEAIDDFEQRGDDVVVHGGRTFFALESKDLDRFVDPVVPEFF
jgi:hypothetical protein